jgi:DtxR family Mn-dependent transcriptional regulator
VPEGFHPAIEQYLETMWELEEEGVPIIRARLAERLGHAAPTVTETVRRLLDKGYVQDSGRTVQMTVSGRELAESVARKHRLAERLLVDVIGLEWHKIHEEAGRWEHVISDDVEARLQELLGHPRTCPHGNPIPGAKRRTTKVRPLTQVEKGDSIRLERISERVEDDHASLVYLAEHDFRPGAPATVLAKAPDGTITLDVEGNAVAIGPTLAALLFVSDGTEDPS